MVKNCLLWSYKISHAFSRGTSAPSGLKGVLGMSMPDVFSGMICNAHKKQN